MRCLVFRWLDKFPGVDGSTENRFDSLKESTKTTGFHKEPRIFQRFCKRSIRLRLVLVGSVSKQYPPGNCPNISPKINGTFELLLLTAFRLVGYGRTVPCRVSIDVFCFIEGVSICFCFSMSWLTPDMKENRL